MCMFYFKDKIDAHKMNTELGICLYVLKSRYIKHCIYNKKLYIHCYTEYNLSLEVTYAYNVKNKKRYIILLHLTYI